MTKKAPCSLEPSFINILETPKAALKRAQSKRWREGVTGAPGYARSQDRDTEN
jgi:hypothetical protein